MRPSSALPDDDKILARMAGLTSEEWGENRGAVLAFWQHDPKQKIFTQKRLSKTKAHVRKTSKKQSSNAKSRWEKEKDTSHGNANVHTNNMPESSQTDASQSQSQSQSPKSSASLPLSVAAQPADAADGRFEEIEKALRAVAGIDQHAVAVAPSIAPIWALFRQGFNLQTEIIPGIKTVLARAKPGTIKGWAYFVDAIKEQRGGSTPSGLSPAVAETSWEDRLWFGRENKAWDSKTWGPRPNSPWCKVPDTLVLPDDGLDWTEWKATG